MLIEVESSSESEEDKDDCLSEEKSDAKEETVDNFIGMQGVEPRAKEEI